MAKDAAWRAAWRAQGLTAATAPSPPPPPETPAPKAASSPLGEDGDDGGSGATGASSAAATAAAGGEDGAAEDVEQHNKKQQLKKKLDYLPMHLRPWAEIAAGLALLPDLEAEAQAKWGCGPLSESSQAQPAVVPQVVDLSQEEAGCGEQGAKGEGEQEQEQEQQQQQQQFQLPPAVATASQFGQRNSMSPASWGEYLSGRSTPVAAEELNIFE